MRILRMAPYITVNEYMYKSNNKTGFGRTCWEITKNWEKSDEVLVLTFERKKINKYRNIQFIRYNTLDAVFHIKVLDLIKCLRFIKKYLNIKKVNIKSIKNIIQFIKSYTAKNYFISIIKKIKPDVIHIHGITPECFSFIDAARETGTPYVINIHGIVTATDFKYPYGKDWELMVINNLVKNKDFIISISNGIYDYVRNNWNINLDKKYQRVIINGCDNKNVFTKNEFEREKLKKEIIGEKFKNLLLSVGSITIDKGQRKIIESINKLPSEILSVSKLFIIGDGPDKNYCKNLVHKYKLEENVIFLGYIDNDLIDIYYSSADLLVLISEAPGFSRMYWESFSQGTPAIACAKQLGINDIFSKECIELANDFTIIEIAKAIEKALIRNWDRKKIVEISRSCTWEYRCIEYNKILNEAIDGKKCFKDSLINDLIDIRD